MQREFKKYFWLYGAVALVVVVSLVVCIGILVGERNKARTMLEAVYEKSFFDLVSDVDDIEIKLDKLSVSTSSSYQRELLGELSQRADLASNNLSALSSMDGTLAETNRYINQLSDYAKSLAKKLSRGEKLSESDKQSLKNLASVCKEISIRLAEIMDEIANGVQFVGKGGEQMLSSIGEMDEVSIDYPELIYDGPFSDSVVNKEPLGIVGEKISVDVGLEIAKKASGEEDLDALGEWEGKINTFNYATDDNSTLVKLGENGMLLMYSTTVSGNGEEISEEECVLVASEYAEQNGFSNLVPVWVSNYDGNVYVNLVYEENDIIYYNDMVKVKVDSRTGKVMAFDAISYAYNHTSRQIEEPAVTEDEAKEKVYGEMSIQSIRLAVVPKEQDEILTWEVFGEINEKKYFVYVDATTGEEINILCVIDSEQGRLLM